jgi:hypothetical protein
LFFYSKFSTKMNKYNIVVIVFRFDFQGQMHSLPPLCVHEQEWGEELWDKEKEKISTSNYNTYT